MKYNLAMLEEFLRGDTRLALRSWVPAAPLATVLYIHGVQSHGGWLFETGPALESLGIALYVLDRRGSGLSEGPRGDVASFHVWIEDLLGVLDLLRARHPRIPLTILGQSLGGSIAAGLACDERAHYEGLLIVAAPLNRMHAAMAPEQLASLLADRSTAARPTQFQDEWFTDEPRYLAFMKEDPLLLRAVTARALAAMIELEAYYMGSSRGWREVPTALILPRRDEVIDLEVTRRAYAQLSRDRGYIVEVPFDHHYLDFSPLRPLVNRMVAQFALAAAGGLPA